MRQVYISFVLVLAFLHVNCDNPVRRHSYNWCFDWSFFNAQDSSPVADTLSFTLSSNIENERDISDTTITGEIFECMSGYNFGSGYGDFYNRGIFLQATFRTGGSIVVDTTINWDSLTFIQGEDEIGAGARVCVDSFYVNVP